MSPAIYKALLMIAIVWIAGFLSSFEIQWVSVSAFASAILSIFLIIVWIVEGESK